MDAVAGLYVLGTPLRRAFAVRTTRYRRVLLNHQVGRRSWRLLVAAVQDFLFFLPDEIVEQPSTHLLVLHAAHHFVAHVVVAVVNHDGPVLA